MLESRLAQKSFALCTLHAGGWDAEDHAEFLSIVRACKGDYAATVELTLEQAIGFSRQDVVAHAHWHMDYLELQAAKKDALARWRGERDAQRAQARAEAAITGDGYEYEGASQVCAIKALAGTHYVRARFSTLQCHGTVSCGTGYFSCNLHA